MASSDAFFCPGFTRQLQNRVNAVNTLSYQLDQNRAKSAAAAAPGDHGELSVDVAAELERHIYVNAQKDPTCKA